MTPRPTKPSAAAMSSASEAIFPFSIRVLFNPVNQGYGGNQKLGYRYAIENGFDFVALLHGDGQYAPESLPELLKPFSDDNVAAVFGSRMMTPGGARRGGMPLYKYFANKILTRIREPASAHGIKRVPLRLSNLRCPRFEIDSVRTQFKRFSLRYRNHHPTRYRETSDRRTPNPHLLWR